MRKFLLLCCLPLLLLGCEAEQVPQDDIKPDAKVHRISLGLRTEGILEEETDLPSGRVAANTTDLIGVVVYRKNLSGNLVRYAYGVFTHKDSLKVDLTQGYEYAVSVTLIRNGSALLYQESDGTFGMPLMVKATNKMEYAANFLQYASYLNGISTKMVDGVLYSYPDLDRFEGAYYGLTVTESSPGNIELNLYRAVFGIEYAASNLKEGTMEISSLLGTVVLTPEQSSVRQRHVLPAPYQILETVPSGSAPVNNNASATFMLTATWKRPDGSSIVIAKKEITFLRNKLRKLTAVINTNTRGFSITEESAYLEQDAVAEIFSSSTPSVSDSVYLIGAMVNWDLSKAVRMENKDGAFEVASYLLQQADGLAFLPRRGQSAWYDQWGSNAPGRLVKRSDPTSPPPTIAVPATGFYLVNADTTALTYNLTALTWGVAGDALPGGWLTDTDMAFDPSTKTYTAEVNLEGGKLIKVRFADAWTLSVGANSVKYGENILINTTGRYRVTLKYLDAMPINPYTYTGSYDLKVEKL